MLGLAGGTAASIASWLSWLSPVLIGLTVLLLGRAHYMLHFLRRGNRLSATITWLATIFVVGYWTWQWAIK